MSIKLILTKNILLIPYVALILISITLTIWRLGVGIETWEEGISQNFVETYSTHLFFSLTIFSIILLTYKLFRTNKLHNDKNKI